MEVKLITFGRLTDIIKCPEIIFTNVRDTNELIQTLHKNYPALAGTKYLVAVDKTMITGNTALTNGSVMALLPPYSGG